MFLIYMVTQLSFWKKQIKFSIILLPSIIVFPSIIFLPSIIILPLNACLQVLKKTRETHIFTKPFRSYYKKHKNKFGHDFILEIKQVKQGESFILHISLSVSNQVI